MIVKAENKNLDTAAALAKKLWPNSADESLKEDVRACIDSDNGAVFLLFDGENPEGFAMCSLRHDYVAGASSSPVGYLEGIYVEPQARRKGAAKRLLECCENWALERGCAELGSDAELHNTVSQSFHQSVGFDEEERVVCYIKKIAR